MYGDLHFHLPDQSSVIHTCSQEQTNKQAGVQIGLSLVLSSPHHFQPGLDLKSSLTLFIVSFLCLFSCSVSFISPLRIHRFCLVQIIKSNFQLLNQGVIAFQSRLMCLSLFSACYVKDSFHLFISLPAVDQRFSSGGFAPSGCSSAALPCCAPSLLWWFHLLSVCLLPRAELHGGGCQHTQSMSDASYDSSHTAGSLCVEVVAIKLSQVYWEIILISLTVISFDKNTLYHMEYIRVCVRVWFWAFACSARSTACAELICSLM